MDYIAITNCSWWKYLQVKSIVERVNFWSTTTRPWAKKLHGGTIVFLCKDSRKVVGWGTYAEAQCETVERAWEVYGQHNGAGSLKQVLDLLNQSGHLKGKPLTAATEIGCNLITNVTWVTTPFDPQERGVEIARHTQRGRTLSPKEKENLLAPNRSQIPVLADSEKGGITRKRQANRRPRTTDDDIV